MRKYTSDESGSTALGQAGSIFHDTGASAISAPTGQAFVAITIISDTKFDALAVESGFNGCGATASTIGGDVINTGGSGTEFPAGITIYGRWSSVDVNAGAIIAYVG